MLRASGNLCWNCAQDFILFSDYSSFFSSKYVHSKQKFVLLFSLNGGIIVRKIAENMLQTSANQC
mgnify:CR=1 FL=1